jgi:hypothetical protein
MVFIGFGKCALMYHLLSVMIVTDQGSEVKSRRFDADMTSSFQIRNGGRSVNACGRVCSRFDGKTAVFHC